MVSSLIRQIMEDIRAGMGEVVMAAAMKDTMEGLFTTPRSALYL
jgi:hypothetical protein